MPKLFSYPSVQGLNRWLMVVGAMALLGLGCGSSLTSPTSSLGAGGTGGQGQVTADASGDDLVCHDYFFQGPDGSPVVACCPDPAHDCPNEPDGYPGYASGSRP